VAKDRGDFTIVYERPLRQENSDVYEVLKGSRWLETAVEDLNRVLALPADIPTHLAECNEVNAFYDPQEKRITICYELIAHIAASFSPQLRSEDELETAVSDTALFVLYHEVGHALVDALHLPVTGREEDAVDQLASLVLLDSGEDGQDAALNGATWFLLRGPRMTDIEELPFWDEHSLDIVRFYNIACWTFGKNPRRYSYLVVEGILPEQRAERCEDEYRKLSDSWSSLLSSYLK